MRLAICGSRYLGHGDDALIEARVADLIGDGVVDEFIFGGAKGTDTAALATACVALAGDRKTKLTVIVPSTVKDQPREAREWITECADEIVEMHLSRGTYSYDDRSLEMLKHADALLAFWDGKSGGTGRAIEAAEAMGLPVELVAIIGKEDSGV